MENEAYIRRYFENYKRTGEEILGKQLDQIDQFIRVLFNAWENNRVVYILGNGGSSSTASHLAADLAKTINDIPGHRGIRALTPWDNIPLISAIVNDRKKEDFFTSWLDTFYEVDGVGIGISVHGGSGSDVGGAWSQNLLKGLQYIKDRRGKTLGLSGFSGGPMAELVDVCITVPVFEDALGTPMVESWHVALHHLIAFCLKEEIQNFHNKGGQS